MEKPRGESCLKREPYESDGMILPGWQTGTEEEPDEIDEYLDNFLDSLLEEFGG